MYEDHENLNYLAHHGILGMKWGKQNGPPYPLSDAKHDRVVQRAEKKRIRREKKADTRKKNILKDPKKIVKYQNEFSKEEIDQALDKMNSVDKVKEKIPIKENSIKNKIRKVRLSARKKHLASTPAKLEKNLHKLTPDEAREALQYLKNTEELFRMKIDKARRPLQVTNTVKDYISSISDFFGNWNKLRDNYVTYRGRGYTNKQRHQMWLADQLADNVSKQYADLLLPQLKGDKYTIDQIIKNDDIRKDLIERMKDEGLL